MEDNVAIYSIGEIVLDKDYDNSECTITNKTSNSIEVFIKKSMRFVDEYGKSKGIDSKHYFPIKDFNKRFIKK
jgi:hypothetical protein